MHALMYALNRKGFIGFTRVAGSFTKYRQSFAATVQRNITQKKSSWSGAQGSLAVNGSSPWPRSIERKGPNGSGETNPRSGWPLWYPGPWPRTSGLSSWLSTGALTRHSAGYCEDPLCVCAVRRRRFPVGSNPTRPRLQPEATGAVMEVTKWLKPSGKERHELVTARVCRPQRE
jgi:hypothetical protein